jgi:F0F1-type ATP synthase assembly protein I
VNGGGVGGWQRPPVEPSAWGNLLVIGSLGIHLVLMTALGVLGGNALDRWLKCAPAGVIGGFLLGICAGGIQIVREVRKFNARQDQKGPSR